MSTLHSLQTEFAKVIIEDDRNGFSENIKALGLDAGRRLQIYRNNFYISLIDALRAVYPVLRRLVGDEFFDRLAKDYIHQQPSRSGNLHDFGDQLATFVGAYPTAKELVYLADVARLEWAYHRVFHAVACDSLDLIKLRQVDEQDYGDLSFALNPASVLLQSPYLILRIWQANQTDCSVSDNPRNELIDLSEGADHLLIIRRDLDIEFQSLSVSEFIFLNALSQGMVLSQACELTQQCDQLCDINTLLLRHTQSKTLIDFSVKRQNSPNNL